jgi:1-acyl-sn-glycerol-3-phosphate acyltransferase
MNAYYQTGYNLFKFFGSLLFSFRVVHQERMIEQGPAILAMNHQSFLDPPLAGISTKRELHILARRSLLKWPVVGRLMPKVNVIPVDRGGADMSALKTLIRVIKQGGGTLLFPEGTRSRDGKLQPAQPGVGLIIAKTLAPVVPMRIFGAFEALPPSGKEFHPIPITVVIGEPIHFTEADLEGATGVELYQRLSDRVMAAIAAIEYEE